MVDNTAATWSDEDGSQDVPADTDSDDVQIVEDVDLAVDKDFTIFGDGTDPSLDVNGDDPEETVTAGGVSGTFYITVTNSGDFVFDSGLPWQIGAVRIMTVCQGSC